MSELIGISIGRYHIIERLGEGGMATVYKAFDTRLNCNAAIKFIRTERLAAETSRIAIKRFQVEAQKMAQLTHPNIIGVTDYGEHEGTPYLVMKYIPGGTLKQKLGNPMPYQEAARLLIPIARALEYAHSLGIIHRDVKPANILLTASEQPMLTDFGIAKILTPDETMDLTSTGTGIGTPEYMSPEQALGQTVDARTDIYALGVVFYELVTGRKPFRADTPMAVIVKQVHDPLPRPKEFVQELPEAVEEAIFKALAKKPEERFENMGAFAEALEKIALNNSAIEKKTDQGQNIETQNGQGSSTRNPFKGMWLAVSLGIIVLISAGLWAWSSGLLKNSSIKTIEQPLITTVSEQEQTQNSPIVGATPHQNETMNPTPVTPITPTTATDTSGTALVDDKPVYSEDFESGFAQGFQFLWGNWSVVDDGTGNKVLEQNNNSEWSEVKFGPDSFSDGVVEFRFRVVRDSDGYNSVVLYLRETPGENGTTYNISYSAVTGITGVSYTPPGKGWQPVEATSGAAKVFPAVGTSIGSWVTMRVVAQGKQIQVFLDNDLIITASDSRISKGILTLGAFENRVVQFDDFKVWKLDNSPQ